MEQDVYSRLIKHLGKVGLGYPQNRADQFLTVLKQKLSREEAEIALGLPVRLPPLEVEAIDTIARRLGKPIDKVHPVLEAMAEKGFLYKRKTASGADGYAFIQIGFGIPQIFFWAGEISEEDKAIASPLGRYLKKGGIEAQHTEHAPFYRYVPINKAVEHATQAVYPSDMMAEVVKKATKIAVCACPCRLMTRLLTGRTCSHSLETCIKFNRMAEFVLERGLGREISQDEALEIIRKSGEEGLVHFVDNCQEEIQHNCNCCSCCCWILRPIKKREVPRDYIMATYYLRTTAEDECTGCGRCAEDCPLEIITMEDDVPVVDESVCIGCGVCLRNCPTGAAQLKKKDDSIPFQDFTTLHQTAIREKTTRQ